MPHSEELEERKERLRARMNDIKIHSVVYGEAVSNFKVREYANPMGIAIVHPLLPRQCEYVRYDLCVKFQRDVLFIITNSTRLPEDTARLVEIYGWVDEGGRVSRDSKHNALTWGGIAGDGFARFKGTTGLEGRIPIHEFARACRPHFDYVKAYAGNEDPNRDHVHFDLREEGRRIR